MSDSDDLPSSPAGSDHTSYGNRGSGDHWVVIQRNTFTNWVREQLDSRRDDVIPPVEDLQNDFCDGIRLCALMEALRDRRIAHVNKNPLNQHHCLDNINLALKAMADDDIKLVNIGAEDILAGNLKLILGMIWRLILRYQIGRGRTPVKKLMLAWINAVVPDELISNFSTDWNSGKALHLQNCQNGMETAKRLFSIPLVLKPENLSSRDLDELSGMTYLSYFMKVNSPGYNATLKWVQQQIPHIKVNNFQTDWNDGKVLTALVHALGGTVQQAPDPNNHSDVLQRAMNGAKLSLHVDQVISPKEMSDPEVDHIGVMAYAARLQAIAVKNRQSTTERMGQEPLRSPHIASIISPRLTQTVAPVTNVRNDVPTLGREIKVLQPAKQVYVNRRSSFTIEMLGRDVNKNVVRTSVIGPATRPVVTQNWSTDRCICEFIPLETGPHKIMVHNQNELVVGCPIPVDVLDDISDLKLFATPVSGQVGKLLPIKIAGARSSSGTPHRGAVRAHARTPNGVTRTMEVTERDGTYTANFTPTETGDWQISITYDDQHILGSPFTVRIFGDPALVKLSGIDRPSVMADTAQFSIETSGANNGELSIDITYKGKRIPATISSEDKNRYHISFKPIGAGTYTIRVLFAGAEVSGSPYYMEIVDTGDVIATGDNLSLSEANHRAVFYLNIGSSGAANEIRVQVLSPRGSKVNADVIDKRNGNLAVEFVPTEVGEHLIHVYYYEKELMGSPYHCQVYDWAKINLTNLPTSAMINRPVEFDIDASMAGAGNLEIMVNDGNIPCSVQTKGNRQFRASFVPVAPIAHCIRMTFNGKELKGSPWRVDVRNPALVSVTSSDVQFVRVGRPAEFEVRTGSIDGIVTANISAPSGRVLRAGATNLRNGAQCVQFTPMEIGSHVIEVLYDGMPVQGTPFIAKAYNTAAILVSPVHMGTVGVPVEFSIDVSQAGEGQLEITVNKGTVPNTARMISKGLYGASFIPRDTRPHEVDIKFNGEPLPQGTITIPIVGKQQTEMWGDDPWSFRFPARSMSESEMTVKVTSPTGELVPARMILQPDGDYKVEYSSRFTGRHTVEITYAGMAIMGSPFFVEIYDPNKIKIEGTKTGIIGERMEFDTGKADLKVTLTGPRGNSVPFDIYTTSTGDHVTYQAREAGVYEIFVTYGGLKVPGCPVKQEIFDHALISVYGEGLTKGCEDQLAIFYVDARGQSGDISVQVDGPNSIAKYNMERDKNGRYKISYIPVEVGLYKIIVKWNSREVEGSPFQAKVIDPRKVVVVGGWQLDANNRIRYNLNEVETILFNTSSAGPGQLSAEMRGPDGPIPVDITLKDRDRYALSFVTRSEGDYVLKVMWNGVMLPSCPVHCSVTKQTPNIHQQASTTSLLQTRTTSSPLPAPVSPPTPATPHVMEKVVMTGVGLKQAFVNQLAEFQIDGANAGSGSPSIQMTGPKGEVHVQCMVVGKSKYRCTYTPQFSGNYQLHINWGDRQVVGSPYRINVLNSVENQVIRMESTMVNYSAADQASKVAIGMDKLQMSGSVGQDISTEVDTRRAGRGLLSAECAGPTKPDIVQLVDHHDGTFTLLIRPQEPGKHLLTVTFNGEQITGSPFTLKISSPPDARKCHVTGPGIQDGVLSTFDSRFRVDTAGAGGGELTVKISGPKGAFHMELAKKNERSFTYEYDPTEVGDYYVSVKWSGANVPGSPFRVHIASTQAELHRWYQRQDSALLQRQPSTNGILRDE